MEKIDTSDKHFQFRCCWTCAHCVLDIARGYLCTASDYYTIPLDGNEDIHKDRRNCKAYKRG